MKISTKGRYVLRMLIDLAEHQGDGYIPLKEIAQRQGVSKKYLEQIVPERGEVFRQLLFAEALLADRAVNDRRLVETIFNLTGFHFR